VTLTARARAEAPVLAWLLLTSLVTYAYFVGPPAWNQNSRFALTRALVEEQTTVIDTAHASTGDKSFREGHFYSDKAPGASLLALPAYGAVELVRRLRGGPLPALEVLPADPVRVAAGATIDPADMQPGDRVVYNQAHRVGLYVCRLLTSSLLATLGLAALYLLLLSSFADRWRHGRRAALLVTLTYGLATPALAYSSVFYGHQLCADFLLLALALTLLTRGDDRWRAPLAVGCCLGWAVLCEYPAAIPVIVLLGFAAWSRGLRFAARVALGGLPWAGLLALYHVVAFGGPFMTGYDFVYLPEFAEGMRVRYGIHAPQAAVALEILFGRYRGLFYLSPVLLLAAWGLTVQATTRLLPETGCAHDWPRRGLAITALVITSYYVLLNSAYYMWDGGAALGPRHCVPMLPFLALGLITGARAIPRTFLALAAISALQLIVATAAAPEAPRFGDPLFSFAWPRLLRGDVSNYAGATNLGRLLGLPGPLSLAPLLLLWLWASQQLYALSPRSPTRAPTRGTDPTGPTRRD
jgi:hypothetical protein